MFHHRVHITGKHEIHAFTTWHLSLLHWCPSPIVTCRFSKPHPPISRGCQLKPAASTKETQFTHRKHPPPPPIGPAPLPVLVALSQGICKGGALCRLFPAWGSRAWHLTTTLRGLGGVLTPTFSLEAGFLNRLHPRG